MMSSSKKRFSANVSQLSFGGYIGKTDKTLHELVPNKMAVKLDVLGSFMKNRVFCNVNSSQVVTLDRDRSNRCDCKLM